MKGCSTVLGLGLVLWLGNSCGPGDSTSPEKAKEAKPSTGQAAILVAQLVRMSGSGSTEEEALQNSAFFSRYGSLDPCGTPRLNRLMKVEQDLLDLGRVALPELMATAGRTETHPVLRKALVDLAARMTLEEEDVRSLLLLLENEPLELVQVACVEAVALQRSNRNIRPLLTLLERPGKVPPYIIHWGLEMSGHQASAGKFLNRVEEILTAEEVESPLADLGIAKTAPPQDYAETILLAKVTKENKWLSEDIWRTGQLGTKQAVEVLIKALRYHDYPTQHMALHFLRKLVDVNLSSKKYDEGEIHTLKTSRDWASWWAASESKLVFDGQVRRYSLKN